MNGIRGRQFWTVVLLCSFCIKAAIIKIGDVVEIQVIEHPEFSGRYSVTEQGTIDYPLPIEHAVLNIHTSELQQELTFLLARHIDNPLILVSIVEKPDITVTVLGQVIKPGVIKTAVGASVQEAIISAGGPVPGAADLSRIKIVRKNQSADQDLFNLESFLVNGDMERMPALYADDVVIVLSREKQSSVKVIGAVQKPGLFSLEEELNLFEAIYLAGGPSEKADLSKVRRFTKTINGVIEEEVVDIRYYIDNGKMERIPSVQEGDVIIVYNKWIDWKTVLVILNSTLLLIITMQAFAGIFK